MTSRLASAFCLLAGLWLGGVGALGCGKNTGERSGPPPEITGLAAVPDTAEVVIGADVAKLAGSPVVERMVDQLLLRNPVLTERWQHLKDNCKIDFVKQIKHVMLATGRSPPLEAPVKAPQVGTGPVIMVVVGSIPEADLKDCVTRLVGAGGGTVTGKPVFGRTLYLAKDGNRTMYFAYGKPDTIVLGSSEQYVTEALGTGKKAPDNPDLMKWIALVNQRAPLWAAGHADPRVRDGLARLTEGKLAAGPVAFTGTADLSDGADLHLGVVMKTLEDAKGLELFAKGELALLTAAAQLKSLGPVVAKVVVAVENEIVRFHAPLTIDDLNLLLSVLDGGGTPAQDAPPPTPGAGSGTK